MISKKERMRMGEYVVQNCICINVQVDNMTKVIDLPVDKNGRITSENEIRKAFDLPEDKRIYLERKTFHKYYFKTYAL